MLDGFTHTHLPKVHLSTLHSYDAFFSETSDRNGEWAGVGHHQDGPKEVCRYLWSNAASSTQVGILNSEVCVLTN